MFYENIIIGAGPAGVQLAYFFKKNNIKYIIFEKNDISCSFFNKYPHSQTLISLNKPFTGKDNAEFNLRHDWNSLLNDDNLLFKDFSESLYPDAGDLVKYINHFSNKYELNISYNCEVKTIQKNNDIYELTVNNDAVNNTINVSCKNLIMGTGLSIPNYPSFEYIGCDKHKVKHYADYEKGYFLDSSNLEKYKGKKVMLIGGGNSSYELANILQSYCSNVIILGSSKELSIVSHYAGDIRTKYLPFLDTFYLKSMNGIDSFDKNTKITIHNIDDVTDKNYSKYKLYSNTFLKYYRDTPDLEFYDEIIYCTGWKFNSDIFNFNVDKTLNDKYPSIKYNYESTNNPHLYFIGSLMHSNDFKISSGGFIHGFRYLLQLFLQINYNVDYTIKKFPFNGTMDCYDALAKHMMYRINNSSSIYQMYGILTDAYYFDKVNKEIVYYESVTIQTMKYLKLNCNMHFLMLKYGEQIYDIRKLGNFNKFNPSLLHPEIMVCDVDCKFIDKIIFDENFVADFSDAAFYEKIRKSLKFCDLII